MEELSRPVPPNSLIDRARAWIAWFGVGRLVASCVATVIVCVGAVWLVRSPAPPTEASLPIATPVTTLLESPPADDDADPSATTVSGGEVEVESSMLVHVAGAVVAPGVYELDVEARIRDAVFAAGGPTDTADWNALNLAARLTDGTRVYVPTLGEGVSVPLVSGGQPTGPASGPASRPGGLIDINDADAVALDELPGVGPATATAIVTERERNGPFVSVDDLERVPGIGPAKLDALRDLVTT